MPAGVERVAADDPAEGQPAAASGAVQGEGLRRVSTARWRETAARTQQGAEPVAVGPDQGEQHACQCSGRAPDICHRAGRRCPDPGGGVVRGEDDPRGRSAPGRAASRSAPSAALLAEPADVPARTTILLPGGRTGSLSRSRCLSRRETVERTTEPPMALLTTSPARARPCSPSSPSSACTVSDGREDRRPRRTTSVKSAGRCRRCSRGSMSSSRSVAAPPEPGRPRRTSLVELGRQLVAALATAAGQDGAAGAGAHAQSEAVGLGTTAVVRLEGALAHGRGSLSG